MSPPGVIESANVGQDLSFSGNIGTVRKNSIFYFLCGMHPIFMGYFVNHLKHFFNIFGATARLFADKGKTMKIKNICILASSLCAACGGGGGGSTPAPTPTPPAVTQYQLQAGYKSLIASGFSKSFTISGTCAGSGQKTVSAPTAGATFNGVAALSTVGTITLSFTNCTPASSAQSYTAYVDSNYMPLGFNSAGVNFGIYLTPPSIPSTVQAGDTGIIGTESLYTDSSMAYSNGTAALSYVVQAASANTVTVDLISKITSAQGVTTTTEQDFYTLDASGKLTPTSVNIQYGNNSNTVLTFN